MESPQAFWMRVAMGLALNEKREDRTDRALEFYQLLSNFDFMCSTPTLFNSGGAFNQLSSCFLSTFDDSINGIFDGLQQEALKNKYAGGLGMDLTNFRATNSHIKSMNGVTQGAVYFWKLYNDMLVAVNQSGKRRGSGCGYLETWHADIEDFIQLRKNTGDERKRTHDMNTANWIPDLFFKRVQEDGPWYLFSPNETRDLHELHDKEFERRYDEYTKQGINGELRVFREIRAKELWKKMLRALFETGHPWITFKDPSNIRYSNQHEGTVHSSNLCVTGDTIVRCMIDGQVSAIRMDELVELHEAGKECLALSYNTETKEYEYKEIQAAAMTNDSADIIEIEDEATGKLLRCTPEHKIYTENRGYVKAKDLKETDKLIFS